VREYAAATGAPPPPDSGPATAPPTFAACFTIGRSGDMFADPELGAHWNLVHGAQEYEFHRPVRVGDALSCTPRIVDIKAKGRMEFLTLEISCNDESSGEPVVTSRGTIIFFGEEG
jgi:acyl dehydratase